MNCGGIPTIYRTWQAWPLRVRHRRTLIGVLGIPEHRVIVVHHVIVVPDGLEIIAAEGVGVEHPTERLRNEAPPGVLALFLGRNPQWAEHRPTIFCLGIPLFLTARWDAPVDVAMPVRNTQWHSLVEIVFGSTPGRGVHRADQLKLAVGFL